MFFENLSFYFALALLVPVLIFLAPSNRWLPLFIFSVTCIYMINGNLLFVFLSVALINYIGMDRLSKSSITKPVLIVVNLSILVFFKYSGLLFSEGSTVVDRIIQPIGISYFVFEQLAFVIDYKKGALNTHVGHYLTASLFVAKFLSGPIERIGVFVNQFKSIDSTRDQSFQAGCGLVYQGLFKKLVIANNLHFYTSAGFSSQVYDRNALVVSILMSKYEIWANFSGYTDIARGIGKILGIDLTENFSRPFNSQTIREFWMKWHISLSSWIRDYVFFPMSGTPFARLGVFGMLLLTFVAFAFWHEISTNLFIYAVLQAVLVYCSARTAPWVERQISKMSSPGLARGIRTFRIAWTYVVLLSIPGVFFRAPSLEQVKFMFGEIFYNRNSEAFDLFGLQRSIGIKPLFVVVGAIVLFELFEAFDGRVLLNKWVKRLSFFPEVLFYVLLILVLVLGASFSDSAGFIYGRY